MVELGGPAHLGAVGLTGAAALSLVLSARRLRRAGDDWAVRAVTAGALAGVEIASWLHAVRQGAVVGLPLHLCDLALILMVWALLGKNRTAAELAYCWGLGGSSQAVLTPDLVEGYPSLSWWQFFLGHGLIVLSAVYLAVRGRARLSARSIWKVWLISNAYVGLAGLVNWRWGTNFGYLARKPAHPSLLDFLGPWPYYILAMDLIALGVFGLCLWMDRAIDRWAQAPEIHERAA